MKALTRVEVATSAATSTTPFFMDEDKGGLPVSEEARTKGKNGNPRNDITTHENPKQSRPLGPFVADRDGKTPGAFDEGGETGGRQSSQRRQSMAYAPTQYILELPAGSQLQDLRVLSDINWAELNKLSFADLFIAYNNNNPFKLKLAMEHEGNGKPQSLPRKIPFNEINKWQGRFKYLATYLDLSTGTDSMVKQGFGKLLAIQFGRSLYEMLAEKSPSDIEELESLIGTTETYLRLKRIGQFE